MTYQNSLNEKSQEQQILDKLSKEYYSIKNRRQRGREREKTIVLQDILAKIKDNVLIPAANKDKESRTRIIPSTIDEMIRQEEHKKLLNDIIDHFYNLTLNEIDSFYFHEEKEEGKTIARKIGLLKKRVKITSHYYINKYTKEIQEYSGLNEDEISSFLDTEYQNINPHKINRIKKVNFKEPLREKFINHRINVIAEYCDYIVSEQNEWLEIHKQIAVQPVPRDEYLRRVINSFLETLIKICMNNQNIQDQYNKFIKNEQRNYLQGLVERKHETAKDKVTNQIHRVKAPSPQSDISKQIPTDVTQCMGNCKQILAQQTNIKIFDIEAYIKACYKKSEAFDRDIVETYSNEYIMSKVRDLIEDELKKIGVPVMKIQENIIIQPGKTKKEIIEEKQGEIDITLNELPNIDINNIIKKIDSSTDDETVNIIIQEYQNQGYTFENERNFRKQILGVFNTGNLNTKNIKTKIINALVNPNLRNYKNGHNKAIHLQNNNLRFLVDHKNTIIGILNHKDYECRLNNHKNIKQSQGT